MSHDTVVVALTTLPDGDEAERFAARVVEERLVACANVLGDVRSVYRWMGSIERTDEVLVILKTTGDGLRRLQDRLAELHPYDVPELVALPVTHGHEPYLDWVRSEMGE